MRLIIGAELTPQDAPPIVLWAPDRAAYGRLARLITLGRRRAVKGECELTFDDLAQHTQGLLAGLVTTADCRSAQDHPRTSRSGPSAAHRLPAVRDTGSPPAGVPATRALEPPTRDMLRQFRDVFADRGYLLAALRRGPDDRRQLEELLVAIAAQRHPAGGLRKRALPRAGALALARRADRRASWNHGGRGG